MTTADTLISKLDKVTRSRTSKDRWQARCPAHDDKGPSLSIRETDDGRVLVHCFAGCSVHEIAQAVGLELSDLFPPGADGQHYRPESLTPAERQALQARLAASRADRAAEQVAIHAEAAKRAARLWGRAVPASNDHPYLVKKQVGAYGIRALRNQIVIPLRTAGGELASLQFIGADGRKILLTGGRKRGCYHAIGRPQAALCICEGYATGATIYQSTGYATAIAFDAGNLLPVAEALRAKFPRLCLVVAADNDTETEGNPGLTAATAAARAVGAALAVPQFGKAANV